MPSRFGRKNVLNLLNVQRGALALVALGSVLPWITVGPFSVSAFDGSDGKLMLVVALAALVLTVRHIRVLSSLATLGVGIFAVEEGVRIWRNITTIPTSIFGNASPGIGLILVQRYRAGRALPEASA
jgi:hypothetical protein